MESRLRFLADHLSLVSHQLFFIPQLAQWCQLHREFRHVFCFIDLFILGFCCLLFGLSGFSFVSCVPLQIERHWLAKKKQLEGVKSDRIRGRVFHIHENFFFFFFISMGEGEGKGGGERRRRRRGSSTSFLTRKAKVRGHQLLSFNR